jgi:hypothetical protein
MVVHRGVQAVDVTDASEIVEARLNQFAETMLQHIKARSYGRIALVFDMKDGVPSDSAVIVKETRRHKAKLSRPSA